MYPQVWLQYSAEISGFVGWQTLIQSSVMLNSYCAFGIGISVNFRPTHFTSSLLCFAAFIKNQIIAKSAEELEEILRSERSPQTVEQRQ